MQLPSRAAGGLLHKLKWLVALRLALAAALLGSAVVLDAYERLPFPTGPLYELLGLTFSLSLLYAVGLRLQRHLAIQGRVQLALDLALITLLIHLTGGVDSALPFMYFFVIFAAANQFERRGTLMIGLLSGLLYALLCVAEGSGIVGPVEFQARITPTRLNNYAAYQVFIHAVAFLAVALLSSHLAERLRQTGAELERRRRDLRDLQTLHEAIVANISSGIVTLDLEGRVLSFNQAAERITGHRFEQLRGRRWEETPFASFSAFDLSADSRAASGQTFGELLLTRGDGQSIPVGIACSPLRSTDGEILGLVAIFQDLTERRRTEEQLRQADRLGALGRLAATIAHEVRNPLAAISGSVEVLREELAAAGRQQQLLDIILGEARRLKFITGQFLDFAKPLPLLRRPCLLRPILVETLQLLERSSEWHADTNWAIEGDEAVEVLADADQLRQVCWNLCLNAIQAMPEGGRLHVSYRFYVEPGAGARTRERSDADWVEIDFSDTGSGIPSGDLARIFDPFYTTRPSGTGLGLSIAKKSVEGMGGRIGVESAPGAGTTLRVWLQRAPALATAGTLAGQKAGEPEH